MRDPIEKAAVLHEALPYIRRFHKRTFVVKYGGHAMVDETLKESFARDVCLLRYVGIQVVVVHGGGPQIDDLLSRLGIAPAFAAGLRVTDERTMEVVEMVLGGKVNQDIVGLVCSHGGRAIGLSGKDDHFIRARPEEPARGVGPDGEETLVDLGRVGRVESVDPTIVQRLMQEGFIPVIAPIAVDEAGRALNVNADTAAAAVAAALGAAKLVLMTDVAGVKDRDGKLLSSVRAQDIGELIATGVVTGGMIPKLQCALEATRGGVEKVHVIDGRARHALLLEIFTDRGVGTEIRRAGAG
ncbi:MAG: acetylglutamate kinase [Polyangiaceae bacterium]|nr:acetylglutamate kinase [Polyangiaceae bacterium]